MKTKFRIGLLLFIVVILYLIYNYMNTSALTPNKNEISTKETSIPAENYSLLEECYYLYEMNEYVVVYLSDKKSVYEYTDILITDLPEHLAREIKNGKYIRNLEDLYGFLENYSS